MGAMAEVKKPNNTIDKLALIVTTYKRQQLLETLFDSILALEQAPWRIVIVDNEQSDQTADMVAAFAGKVTGQWGTTVADQSGNEERVVYAPQTENLGGAGGFSAGVAKAYELGAAWFWVMDDDVAVLPDAIAKLSKWTDKHEVIQGSRFDYDGGPFYWQYDFIVPLGIPNPIAPAAFGPAGYRVMDTLCFEGGLFNRRVVTEIGLPDPRFFIYWDDTMYGYRASKVTNPIVVPDVILRRTREIGNWDIAGVRQLNSTSDMNRYHIMRNRGYMARYFMTYGSRAPQDRFGADCQGLVGLAQADARPHLEAHAVAEVAVVVAPLYEGGHYRLLMNEQATVAPSPLALAGTDLEVQLGDAHVIERVMLISRTLIDMRGGGIVGRIIREGDWLTVHRARRLHRSLDAGLEPIRSGLAPLIAHCGGELLKGLGGAVRALRFA